jgi:sulfatase modifying factor 1
MVWQIQRKIGVGALAASLAGGAGMTASGVAPAEAAGCPAGMAQVLGRFCIDRYEATVDRVDARGRTVGRQSPYHTPAPGERLRARSRAGAVPQAHISQVDAAAACAAAGKRLCTDEEWLTACRGRTPTRYPYGDEHQDGRCNDAGVSPLRTLHGRDDSSSTFGIDAMNDARLNQVPGSVARTGAFSRCRNSFGVYDMVGNLHEWTAAPGGTFRGGYYLDTSINGEGCEYQTTAHSPHYHDYSIGFRCCRSLGGEGRPPPAAALRASPPDAPRAESARGERQRGQLARGERRYVVRDGDTLSAIAAHHGVTVTALCARNALDVSRPLRLGRELVIPSPVGPANLARAPREAGPVHVVRSGQTLSEIAVERGTTVAELCALNGIDRETPIREGQRLRVPPPAARSR